MLYTPAHFAASRPTAEAVALMLSHPFATLVTTVAGEPEPWISHLPLLWDADRGALNGHVAHANGHWQHFGRGHTVAIFHGPHAYVSPAWYADPASHVPTWNYATAHAHGQPQLVGSAGEKLALIDRSIAVFESGRTPPWQRALDPQRLDAMLRNIVAFRIVPERIDIKLKMSQNRTAADRVGVIAQLRRSSDTAEQRVAQWMRGHESG